MHPEKEMAKLPRYYDDEKKNKQTNKQTKKERDLINDQVLAHNVSYIVFAEGVVERGVLGRERVRRENLSSQVVKLLI